jgi:antitoxin VapB
MQTAKIFKNGRSQAVRLPAEFRFEGDEVLIRRDPVSGDVVLSAKPASLDAFFRLRDLLLKQAPEEFAGFLDERDQGPHTERDWP